MNNQKITDLLDSLYAMRESVIEGKTEALQAMYCIKNIMDLCESIKSEIREYAVQEAEAYGPGLHTHISGFRFNVQETGTRYKYDENPEWAFLKSEIKRIEALLQKGGVDNETGEKFKPVTKLSTKSVILR